MKTLWQDRRGGTGLIAAGALPLILGFSAFAVDVGSATLESRRLQGVADAAALAAAGDPDHAQALAEASVAASGWPHAVTVTAQAGSYARDAATPVAARFSTAGSYDAARVSISSPSPTFFARIFGQKEIVLSRSATAARERMAAFSIGSRLAAVNGGLLNAYLSGLTGSSVSLTAMDYNGLAGADVDLFGYLDALRTTAHLNALTFNDIVQAQVTRGQALSALADTIQAGNPIAAAALRKLSAQAGDGTLSLGTLIDPGKLGGSAGGLAGMARINAMAAVTAIIQTSTQTRQVAVDLGASLPGIASSKVWIAVGERPNNSPWITVTDNGSPIVRTAQARIYTENQVGGLSLPGIGGLASIKAPLFVELASAEGRLSAIDCSTATTRGVTVEARPSPGKAAIATVDTARLSDFTSAMPLSPARIVDTPLVDVDGNAAIDLGAAEPWRPLRFGMTDISAGTPQTVSSGALTQGIAAALVSQATLTVRVVGLPIPVAPLTQAVGQQLGVLAPALDGLIDSATGALGVHFGQADVRVTGMRCGTAALVA